MKQKGFTLVELLAVIVILAIIALIAIPTITKVVDEAKKGASVSSAYGYIDAVEKYMMTSKLSSNKAEYELKDNVYDVVKESNNIPGLNTFIKINGEKPIKGSVTIEKGKVKNAEFGLKGYRIVCQNDKCNVIGTYEEITITYNLNGGTLDKTSEKVYKGDSLLLPTPLKTDYIFDGWYTELNGGVKVTDETTFNNAQTLYAHWTELELSSIIIKTQPTKLSYTSGDKLDLTGLEVLATYENGFEETLEYSDITSSQAHNTKLSGSGEKTITISYGTGTNIKNASFTVNVDPIRIPYKSSNTFDYNGYNGDMSNYTSTIRNSNSTLRGAPYIELPDNVVGKTLNVKYELDQTYSNFQIAFIDKDDNIIGNAYWYCNPANARDMNLSRVGMTSTYRELPIELGDIQNNNILSTASLVIPSGSKYVKILQFNTSHGAKIYDTYITA